jgi:hypothetical protein
MIIFHPLTFLLFKIPFSIDGGNLGTAKREKKTNNNNNDGSP